MSKEERISEFTAGKATNALKTRRATVSDQLAAVEAELQSDEAKTIQGKIAERDALRRELQEIDTGISNIEWARKNPVQVSGGGCFS